MKLLYLLFSALLLTVTPVFGQNATPLTSTSQSSSNVQTILQLERDLVNAYNTGDTKVLERILADDLEVDAHVTKPLLLEYKKPFDADVIDVNNLKARVWGNAAVATGILVLTNKGGVKTDTSYQRFTDTFVNRQNKWQLVSSQTKDVPIWEVRKLANNELTPLTAISCEQESSLRSREGNTSAFIKFTNASQQPITIQWINREGKRDPRPSQIDTVDPSKSSTMYTYLTHPFVITDASGKCMGIYMAKKEPGLVVIK